MATRKEEVRQQLEALVKKGRELFMKLTQKTDPVMFGTTYQDWYTQTLPLVRSLAPDRLPEFRAYYETDPKRKGFGAASYTLQDYVNGMSPAPDRLGQVAFDHHQAAMAKMLNQVNILDSLASRIEGVLANIEGHLLAEIEDRELNAAAELSKSNLRAAGALAGVVLERHLGQVLLNRGVKVGKRDSTIGDLNEALKREVAYDLPTYRKIQFLADIRNVCCHNKGREPSADEVRELLDGVGAVIKTVF